MAPPPPRSQQGAPPARPPKSSQAPLLDPPMVPEAFRPGKGRTSTLTSPPPVFSNTSDTSTLRADERESTSKEGKSSPKARDSNSKKRNLKEQQQDSLREGLHSPSPPPPPSLTSLGEQEEFPPPPSYSTLKRLTTYRRSVHDLHFILPRIATLILISGHCATQSTLTMQ